LAATAISMTARSSRAFANSSRGRIAPPSQPMLTAASAVASRA